MSLKLRSFTLVATAALIFLHCEAAVAAAEAKLVTYRTEPSELQGWLCVPDGKGPFPLVVYNHGGLGDVVGGPPRETAEALAKAGFVGFSPLRRRTRDLRGHPDDVAAAIDYAKALPKSDPERIALMGFSRGGLLTFMAATQRRDLDALVLMAPASGRGALERFLPRAKQVGAPSLILVAENDNRQADHVSLSRQVAKALEDAGNEVHLTIYPPHGSDGHRLFFSLGSYWRDVVKFLGKHLRA